MNNILLTFCLRFEYSSKNCEIQREHKVMQYMHCPETTSESSLQKKKLVYAYNTVKKF